MSVDTRMDELRYSHGWRTTERETDRIPKSIHSSTLNITATRTQGTSHAICLLKFQNRSSESVRTGVRTVNTGGVDWVTTGGGLWGAGNV